jgi:hypothetical protein
MTKIEFTQPDRGYEDWRVKMNGNTIGSVWKAEGGYIASVSSEARTATIEQAFDSARKQAKQLFSSAKPKPTTLKQ